MTTVELIILHSYPRKEICIKKEMWSVKNLCYKEQNIRNFHMKKKLYTIRQFIVILKNVREQT